MAYIRVKNRAGVTRLIEGRLGASLMENLRDNSLDIEGACGGCCSCGTCHVFVDAAWAGKLDQPEENELSLVRQLPSFRAWTSRLACQITFCERLDGISVEVAPPQE